jgi:hypothetical protein
MVKIPRSCRVSILGCSTGFWGFKNTAERILKVLEGPLIL